MSLKVLIVEDVDELYEYYLRIFQHSLPMEEIELTRTSSIQATVEIMSEPWDVILMDYMLGEPVTLEGMSFKTGKDLVAFRRALEGSTGSLRPCLIVGISSNEVGNQLMIEHGADQGLLKLRVPEMAQILSTLLVEKKQANV